MTLLVDFLCRFGWGMAVALVLTPAAVVPAGFFRVNLLVVLGIATVAAFLARAEVGGPAWLLAAAAAVSAWLGSVAWYAERRRGGRLFCAACAAALAGATAVVQFDLSVTGVAAALLSGLVVGFTVHAMLLGHWYLNAPGMRVDALRKMIDVALLAWGLQLAASIAGVAMHGIGPAGGATSTALVSLRWLAGLAGLPVLLVLARKTLDIPNTQSATGILYVACLAAILGELTGQLLQAA